MGNKCFGPLMLWSTLPSYALRPPSVHSATASFVQMCCSRPDGVQALFRYRAQHPSAFTAEPNAPLNAMRAAQWVRAALSAERRRASTTPSSEQPPICWRLTSCWIVLGPPFSLHQRPVDALQPALVPYRLSPCSSWHMLWSRLLPVYLMPLFCPAQVIDAILSNPEDRTKCNLVSVRRVHAHSITCTQAGMPACIHPHTVVLHTKKAENHSALQ